MRQQAGILLKPKNLLRTVAGQIPIASIATEFMDQIEGHETERRIESLEADVKSLAKLKALEAANPKTPAPLHDWSVPAGEYRRRTVDVAVVYDGGFHSRSERGRELIQVVGHACIIGDREVLVCKEALEMARYAAEHKHGKVIMLVGMAWYEFSAEAPEKASGLPSRSRGELWASIQRRQTFCACMRSPCQYWSATSGERTSSPARSLKFVNSWPPRTRNLSPSSRVN